MISASKTMTMLTPDHVEKILDKPDGFRAACVSKELVSDVLAETIDLMKSRERNVEMQKQNVQQMEQQNVNTVQMPV